MMSHRSRLGSITRHVLPDSDSAAAPTPDPGAALKLLDDAQLQTFLGQGFLMLKVEELGPDFHRAVYENAYEEYGPGAEEGGGAHGTTVERVPGLTTLIESPTVAGALQSLLGPDYAHGHLGVAGCAFHASASSGVSSSAASSGSAPPSARAKTHSTAKASGAAKRSIATRLFDRHAPSHSTSTKNVFAVASAHPSYVSATQE